MKLHCEPDLGGRFRRQEFCRTEFTVTRSRGLLLLRAHRVVLLDVEAGDPPPVAHGPRLRIEPNPFNPQAMVRFRLDATGPVRLELYDARGRKMDTLVEGTMPAGIHEVRLVRANSQARFASGIYFVRLRADGQDTRAKAVLIK